MSRLIDADALIEAINKSTCHWAENMWKQVVRDVIYNQPTAYDVEKVVAELDEERVSHLRLIENSDNKLANAYDLGRS